MSGFECHPRPIELRGSGLGGTAKQANNPGAKQANNPGAKQADNPGGTAKQADNPGGTAKQA